MENLALGTIDNAESVKAVSETFDSNSVIGGLRMENAESTLNESSLTVGTTSAVEQKKITRFTPEQKEQIKQLKLSGMGTEEIAKTVGCSKTTVQTTLNGGSKKMSDAEKFAKKLEKQTQQEVERQKELLRQIELIKSMASQKAALKIEQEKTAELEKQLADLLSLSA